jgi:hypothetical protein
MAGTYMPALSSSIEACIVEVSSPSTRGMIGLVAGTPRSDPRRSTMDHRWTRRQVSLVTRRRVDVCAALSAGERDSLTKTLTHQCLLTWQTPAEPPGQPPRQALAVLLNICMTGLW